MFLKPFETKQMLEAILSSLDEAIHVVNSEGVTIFYNEVAAKHDGVGIDEVLGKHVLDVFPSLVRETSTLLKVMETGKPIFQQPQTYKNSKGQLIDTVNTTLPIRAGEQIIGAVEIAKDLTTVKQLSQKLIDLQQKVDKKTNKPISMSGAKYVLNDIITSCEKMEKVKIHAEKAAQSSAPVLVFGETGTGKELVVQSIHNGSSRKDEPFIAQNCAALPSSLLESILFGTKKGSFTGAIDRPGLFELAHGGTLFLDEINSMPLEIQAKLLRVLEDGVIRRVGGTNSYVIDVRVIVAMNEHPLKCIENNMLRSDLFYRLNVFFIEIPPLRQRKKDIPLLIDHFIKKYNYKYNKLISAMDDDVLALLESHNWLGNVRELEHVIEYAVNMTDGDRISMSNVPLALRESSISPKEQSGKRPLRLYLEKTEKKLIEHALNESDGKIAQAAKILDIPRQTLQYKLNKYNIMKETD
ncbi:sigma-54 interaction domain-containing protein [Bacillus sp. Marseille-P3661]|uniref:sigma-54 interaction domain-containing protein n=1 Tax=Bacillus sp. Marseille-P3661 TaxID=1936234 RepID=UPI0035B5196F